MKIRIAKVVDGAARSLLVAGTLGIPAAALAQTTPYPTLQRPTPVYHAVPQTESSQPGRTARLIEMKVELAWLADPVTSPCRLEARTMGSTLEVHGQVPGEGELEHALYLAREESGMRVLNKVQLNPRLRGPGSSKPQEALHREAFNAVRQGFPENAPAITVSTLADGQVVLKGTIPTYEDKLAISRHLRQATSCSCIINQLRVLAEPQGHAGKNSTPSVAATLLTPERLKSPSIQPVSHVPNASPTAPATVAPAPHSSTGTTEGGGAWLAAVKTSGTGSEQSLAPTVAVKNEPGSLPSAPEAQSTTAAKPATKPLVYRTKWRRMDPSEIVMSKRVDPASDKTSEAQALASKSPQIYFRVIPSPNEDAPTSTANSGLAKAESSTVPTSSLQVRTSPVQPPPPGLGLSAPKSQIALASASNPTTSLMPAARPQGAVPTKTEPYVAEGVVIMDSAFKPAGHSVPAPGEKAPAVVRTGPYVTNGVILFSDSAHEDLLKSNPALAALQTHLQQRIAAACGKSSKDIEVKATTETELAVRVKANSTLEGEELSNRIFQLPELGPCQVSLDVLVMK
jgi:hypothetical protein